MKGSFPKLSIVEHGMSCVSAPSLAVFEAWAGKPPKGEVELRQGPSFSPSSCCFPCPSLSSSGCAELLVSLL